VRNVYFFEAIGAESEQDNLTAVTLFNATEYYENSELEDGAYFSTVKIPQEKVDASLQAGFVYYENNLLTNANADSISRHFIFQNTNLRRSLINNSLSESQRVEYSDQVYSYHINVGHGNCSLVFDKATNSLTIIDCSKYDYLIGRSYISNIDDCLIHIKEKFGIFNLNADILVLTHPHYDHYSGMEYLICNNIVTSNTVVYINQYYSMPSPKLNSLLKQIGDLGSRTIEPLVSNSISSFDILYPSSRVVKTGLTVYNHLNPIVEKNPNNASMVFRLLSQSGSFMFTGDIETEGWNRISNCAPYLRGSRYYAVSHHGSINGHLRSKCPAKFSIASVADCLFEDTQSVLMGRQNAYHSMPSSLVLSDLPHTISSEMDLTGVPKRYLEIEWSSGAFAWY